MAHADERFVLNEECLDELYSWIDSVPLSRPKKNIARDFSDGVLVAEIVHHFLPGGNIIELHNYIAASGAGQKKINWNTLNRKVFTKMGMRLSDQTMKDLIEAKSGTIEQVLWDLRQKISDVIANPRIVKPHRPVRASSVSRYAKSDRNGYIGDKEFDVTLSSRRTSSNTKCSLNSNQMPSGYATNSGTGSGAVELNSVYQLGKVPSGVTTNEENLSPYTTPPVVGSSEVLNNLVNSPPGQIIYRGHKMVPWEIVEQREKEIKLSEQNIKNLNVKVHRLQNLVNLKDERLEDLTHQLHNLRSMYEKVTQAAWDGVAN